VTDKKRNYPSDPFKPVKIDSSSSRKRPAAHTNTPRPLTSKQKEKSSESSGEIPNQPIESPTPVKLRDKKKETDYQRTPPAMKRDRTAGEGRKSDTDELFEKLPKLDTIHSPEANDDQNWVPADKNQTPKKQPGYKRNPSKDDTDPSPDFAPFQAKESYEDYRRISGEMNKLPDFSDSEEQSESKEVTFPVHKRKKLPEDTEKKKTGTIFKYNDDRRMELANLLWGESEDEFHNQENEFEKDETDPADARDKIKSLRELRDEEKRKQRIHKLSDTQPQITEINPSKMFPVKRDGVGSHPSRKFQRRECSFPGILTILVPTETFQPVKVAVRVIDISPQGARLETKQIDKEMSEKLREDKWFCRLEMLVPRRDKVRCIARVAWVKQGDQDSELGIQFDEIMSELDEIFADGVSRDSSLENMALRPPILDQFPSITPASEFNFGGEVPDCDKVVVTRGIKKYETVPINGRFLIKVPLAENRTNFLSFICQRGDQQSIPTPAVILQKIGSEDSVSAHGSSLVEDFSLSMDGKRLQVSLHGPPSQFFRALKRIEESLQYADDVFLSVDIRGKASEAAERLESLKDEKA